MTDQETIALMRALGVEARQEARPLTAKELASDPDFLEWKREREFAGLMSVKVHRKRRGSARKALTSRDVRPERKPAGPESAWFGGER